MAPDQAVVVWMEAGLPARLVFERARWRVEGRPEPIVEVPDGLLHPLITHVGEQQVGWRCRVQRDDGGERLSLELRRADTWWIAERCEH